jgi:hypothetical protein
MLVFFVGWFVKCGLSHDLFFLYIDVYILANWQTTHGLFFGGSCHESWVGYIPGKLTEQRKIIIFNGKIHYFYGHGFISYVDITAMYIPGCYIYVGLWLADRNLLTWSFLPWKIPMLSIGKPSISMGHLYHVYVK